MKNQEIIDMAKQCLNCKNKPCSNACPMKTDIPIFIKQITKEDFKAAYETLINNNIFSHVCSIVCPHEKQCQGSCVRGIKGEPVQIGKLENFVNKWAEENNYKKSISTNKINNSFSEVEKVAIIGGGPTSLAFAYELLKAGVAAIIFEKEQELGGILRYGIPDFRLPKYIVDITINKLKEMGLKYQTGMELGKNISINELKNQGYKTIFLGIGAQKAKTYKLSEEECEQDNIYEASYILKEYNTGKKIDNLGKVIVIGGGNVAIDSARAAKKMGAKKVSILYRRDETHMPARKIEIKEALEDGIEIKYSSKVTKINANKFAKIKNVECIQTKLEEEKLLEIPKSEFIVEADTIIFAIGLTPKEEMLKKEGLELEKGLIKINENCQTNIEGVYAGGDLTQSKSTVCKAIAAGKKAALNVLEMR